MEVDIHLHSRSHHHHQSPSKARGLEGRNAMRSVSTNKRRRSPSSPNSLERATKRPIVITPDVSTAYSTPWPSLPSEEQWVVDQTQGLSIHSPAIDSSDPLKSLLDEGKETSERDDIQMKSPDIDGAAHQFPSVDHFPIPDVEISATSTPRANRRRPSSHQCLPFVNNNNSNALQLQLPLLSSSSLHCHQEDPVTPPSQFSAYASRANGRIEGSSSQFDSSTPSTSSLSLPHIHVQPATPSTPQSRKRYERDSFFPALIPSSPSSPMSLEPTSPALSSSSILSPGGRKRQVTMGPRSDCEKCRNRTPGHWIHFD